ncbi:bifunctional methyltransferase/pyrophosphohydrolase YabN [Alkaliphilus crotonatoxidans]
MGKITVVGLGPGALEHVTLAALNEMKRHKRIFLRTMHHPTVALLKDITYEAFDSYYETFDSFDEVYDQIVMALLGAAQEEDVLYAVPGHPYVAESTVERLMVAARVQQIPVEVHPAMSFIDVMLPAVGLDPVAGFKLIDGLQLDRQEPDPSTATIITQVYDPFIASQVKLRLMDYYHDDQEIVVVKNAGTSTLERIERIPLYQLDRLEWIDYLTSVYIPSIDTLEKKYYNMNNLIEIMEILRSKDGCPWDIQQNHRSLKPYLIEEAYEVLEAIDLEDDFLLEEELGDLLLQVVFHSQIAKERQAFTMGDVIRGICEKLIFRHPHVFKDTQANNQDEALEAWEASKREEKKITSLTESMKLIPKQLPATMRAYKIQKKAAEVGFDWDTLEETAGKIEEELKELKEAIMEGAAEKILGEGGDLLFAVVNFLRFLKVEPEEALNLTNQKFIERFSYIEERAKDTGKALKEMTLAEMDILWEEAKRKNHT